VVFGDGRYKPRRVSTVSQRGIAAVAWVLILLNLAVFGLVGWKIWRVNQPTAMDAPTTMAASNEVTIDSPRDSFRITFPAGWNNVLRVMDSDRFVVQGTSQPVVSEATPAKVVDVISFADKGEVVFDAAVGNNFEAPNGEASDFLFGSGKSLLSGRRYIHTYQGDDLTGTRRTGDKDYIYSFALGGSRELRVTYRVFAADPTDNVKTVDQIVRSIRRL